jgi:hypothetical protein
VFGEATFTGIARFSDATFTADALFDKATFETDVWFDGVTFDMDAWFIGVVLVEKHDAFEVREGTWYRLVRVPNGKPTDPTMPAEA